MPQTPFRKEEPLDAVSLPPDRFQEAAAASDINGPGSTLPQVSKHYMMVSTLFMGLTYLVNFKPRKQASKAFACHTLAMYPPWSSLFSMRVQGLRKLPTGLI